MPPAEDKEDIVTKIADRIYALIAETERTPRKSADAFWVDALLRDTDIGMELEHLFSHDQQRMGLEALNPEERRQVYARIANRAKADRLALDLSEADLTALVALILGAGIETKLPGQNIISAYQGGNALAADRATMAAALRALGEGATHVALVPAKELETFRLFVAEMKTQFPGKHVALIPCAMPPIAATARGARLDIAAVSAALAAPDVAPFTDSAVFALQPGVSVDFAALERTKLSGLAFSVLSGEGLVFLPRSHAITDEVTRALRALIQA